MSPQPAPVDRIHRGVKRPDFLGIALFAGLRLLDVPLQYKILTGAWSVPLLARIGFTPVTAVHLTTDIAAIDRLGLSGPSMLLLAMAAGSAAKHVYWVTRVCYEEFPPSSAVPVAVFNAVFNSLNSLLLIAAATSTILATPRMPVLNVPLPRAVGAVMYAGGLYLETWSEVQRLRFKQDPSNKGQICTSGLWSWARHINYTRYILWRTGYSLAAGGWIPGVLSAVWYVYNLKEATVCLQWYMNQKYGEKWETYRKQVKWLLFPGLY